MRRLLTTALLGATVLAGPALADPQQLAADAAWTMVQRGDLVLIDVRTPSEWAMTGLPRDAHVATLQDVDFLDQARGAVLGDLDQPVAVVCRSGARSALAADTLRDLGFVDALSLAGGFNAWAQAGRPVTPGDSP